jgi:hypothetical protein
MALIIADRIRETTTTSGTGDIYLGGAVAGFNTFSSVLVNGDTTFYSMIATSGGAWEVGVGTYSLSTNSLVRTTILSSSNAGTIVSFSSGTKNIFITQPASRSVYVDGTNVVASNSATIPNSLLANSAVTINGTSVALGSSATITAAASAALTIGTGLSGTSYNGSTAATITIDNTVVTLAGSQTLTSKTLTAPSLTAGTAAAGTAPLKFNSGTNLTAAEAGAVEYDGNVFYATSDVTSGRGLVPSAQYFRLTADGSALGPTIANFFGATSGMALDTSVFYEAEFYLYFTKTTAGTVTFTLTFANAPINLNAYYEGSPVGGVGTVGAPQTAALAKSAATSNALPVTGSLTTAVNHQYVVKTMFQANATTGGTVNLQVTSSAGTATPLTGSYYKITRLPATNTGAFV